MKKSIRNNDMDKTDMDNMEMSTDQSKYPECDKMTLVAKESQAIGEFIDWLRYDKNIVLATAIDENDNGYMTQVHYSMENLLAEYYKIDLKVVEKERQQILEEIRKINK